MNIQAIAKNLLGIALLAASASAQSRYVITDLGTLGGTGSATPNAINNLGQVTGRASTAAGESHAFRTAPNSVINAATDDLGTLGGTSSDGSAINDSGQVAGSSSTGSQTHAFRSSANFQTLSLTDLGTFDGTSSSFGSGINVNGQVTGQAHVASTAACFSIFSNSAFRTTSSSTVAGGDNLGTLLVNNCRSAQGWAINDLGVVVGDSATVLLTGTPNHAFRAAPGNNMVSIHPGGSFITSNARGINSNGQIVGAVTNSINQSFCYRTVPGQNITLFSDDLGNLGLPFCQAHSINAAGDVVGYTGSNVPSPAIHAFVYTNGTMYDLNGLIGSNPPVVLSIAYGINNSGQIVAGAVVDSVNFISHGFRLDPADSAVSMLTNKLSDASLGLTSGQIANLTDKLNNALISIQSGLYKQATNQLNAFISFVNISVKTGKMTASSGATLTAAANAIIAAIS